MITTDTELDHALALMAVRDAARALNEKLDRIWADPSYMAQVQIAHMHGFVYSGPNCAAEQRALRAALDALPADEPEAGR